MEEAPNTSNQTVLSTPPSAVSGVDGASNVSSELFQRAKRGTPRRLVRWGGVIGADDLVGRRRPARNPPGGITHLFLSFMVASTVTPPQKTCNYFVSTANDALNYNLKDLDTVNVS